MAAKARINIAVTSALKKRLDKHKFDKSEVCQHALTKVCDMLDAIGEPRQKGMDEKTYQRLLETKIKDYKTMFEEGESYADIFVKKEASIHQLEKLIDLSLRVKPSILDWKQVGFAIANKESPTKFWKRLTTFDFYLVKQHGFVDGFVARCVTELEKFRLLERKRKGKEKTSIGKPMPRRITAKRKRQNSKNQQQIVKKRKINKS